MLRKVAVRYNIETFYFIIFLGSSFLWPYFPPSKRQKMVDSYFNETAELNSKQADDFVQRRVVEWDNYHRGVWIPFVCLSTAIFGAWSDAHGRQVLLLVGLASMMFEFNSWNFLWADSTQWPLWTNQLAATIYAISGSVEIAYVAVRAYLADTVADKDALTIRYVVLDVLAAAGTVIGSLAVALLDKRLNRTTWFTISFAIWTLAFFQALLLIPQIPPKLLQQRRRDTISGVQATTTEEEEIEERAEKKPFSAVRVVRSRARLAWVAVKALFKRRQHRKRTLLLLLISARFLFSIAGREKTQLFSLYAVRRVFHWAPRQFGLYIAASTILNGVGTLVGVMVMKKWLKMADTAVMLVAQLSNIASVVAIILATESWQFFLSPFLGLFNQASLPVMMAYTTRLIGVDEIGKVVSVFQIMEILAFVVQQYVLQDIYAWTVGAHPKTVFVIVIAFYVVGLAVIAAAHFLSRQQRIEEKPQD